MTGILNALIAGVSGAVKDAYFNLVSLLLPGNGTNGAQNNTFLDSSGNTFTITRNGNTTQGTFSPFSQTGWGNYFSSTGLTVASNSAFSFGTGQFTFETWFYSTGANSSDQLFYDLGAANTAGSFAVFTTTGVLYVRIGGLGNDVTYTLTSSWPNQWHHLAVVRDSSNLLTVYLDGQSIASGTRAQDVTQSSPYIAKGTGATSTFAFSGYLSNTRVVKGVAVYTGNFTPPISPLTATQSAGTNISAITGTQTSLLTCQSNRFIDNSVANSGAGFTITPNGSPSVVPFSPFAPTAKYETATVGGSGYFDGTGDRLSFTDSSNALDFGGNQASFDCWVYAGGVSSAQHIISKSGGTTDWNTSTGLYWILRMNSSAFNLEYNNAGSQAQINTGTIYPNTWNHVCIASNTSNTLAIYLNGVRAATATNAITKPTTRTQMYVGGFSGASVDLNGYVSNCRFLTGSNAFDPTQTSITIPTAPPTAVSGTQLLLNFTNAGVVDATAKNVLETVGNAQISTTQSKWGGGSISIPGSSYLFSNSAVSDLCAFGTGDFCIEFWLYLSSTTGTQIFYDARPLGVGTGVYIAIYKNPSNQIALYVNAADRIVGATTVTTGQWYHVALARASGNTRLYLAGNQQGSTYSDTNSYLNGTGRPAIGAEGSIASSNPMNGYIDDLRVTKGNARGYTGTTITVPTAPFPVQ